MAYRKLKSEQVRVAVNSSQLFEQYEQHRLQANSVSGSMHWKKIGGCEYLYRAFSYGKNQSLGRRSPETELIKQQFEHRRNEYHLQDEAFKEGLVRQAAYIRANHLNRFPTAGAKVLRALGKAGIPYRLIGTNALYVFELQAGVMIQPEHLATEDMDVLMDARQGVKIVANLPRRSLLAMLKETDSSFKRLSSSSFEFAAANNQGYRVDFITQGSDPMGRNDFEDALDADDLKPISIDSLKWHIHSPHYNAIVFDEKGMPLRVHTVDPRAFVLHKWYVSQQQDREPMKRIRDESQARLMATMLSLELSHLPVPKAISRIFPHTLTQQATQALSEFDL